MSKKKNANHLFVQAPVKKVIKTYETEVGQFEITDAESIGKFSDEAVAARAAARGWTK